MSRISVAWRFAGTLLLLLTGACADRSAAGGETPGGACEDIDRDGFGRGCANGYDCDDHNPKITHECRNCAQPDHGCPCEEEGAAQSCFLPARDLPEGKLMCSEGTRTCRSGVWSGCESVHEYVMEKPQTQGITVPSAGRETCDGCDLKCFRVVDNLLTEGGVAGGTVTFGPSGGLVLLPGDGGVADGGVDAGPVVPGCTGLNLCCDTLSGALKTQCQATASAGNAARCDSEKPTFCPSGTITGPVANCTLGTGPDSDCDGIPNSVDNLLGKPFSTTGNQTIFHQLDVGETGTNNIDVAFKLKNADVYFLLDTTGTMIDERDNLLATLTSGNVVNCAQLSQCCAGNTTCTGIVSANNQTNCYNAQPTYCGKYVDCADANLDGAPDNNLRTEGVVGAIRCLVGTSWFGTGYFREMPAHKDPEPDPVWGEGERYGDRDEHVYRHLIDMTPDYDQVRKALGAMSMNYNWDEPEGGFMALYSTLTGKGHYFGINRPAVPERTSAQGCATSDMFGYPCFRKDAVPVIVYLTDRPSHNGPGDATTDTTNCEGRGAGCPYSDLDSLNTWATDPSEASSDKRAQFVSGEAEGFGTAYALGDIRGKYYSLVGNTEHMAADYPTSIIGCGAAGDSPDALISFKLSAGSNITVRLQMTKNNAYSGSLYGRWNPTWLATGTDDPTPATDFGSVISLFEGVPAAVSTTIDVMDKLENPVVSGPNGAYLSYVGSTSGAMSTPGLWGGISGCGADGSTNQTAFTFKPTADARIVFDATGSSFPVNLSLHKAKRSDLPGNPTVIGITNDNDKFATANSVPSGSTQIDGAYVERVGDTAASTIHADYTSATVLRVSGVRTQNSDQIKGLTNVPALYVGQKLASSAGWSTDPVEIVALSGNVATMSAAWTGTTDALPTTLSFNDSLTGCGADPGSRESVFKFTVGSQRRVRIDTEGSSYDTVISLHDGPPVEGVTMANVSGNGVAPGYDMGELTGKSFALSDITSMGTNSLPNTYDFTQCGGAAAAKDAIFKFTLAKSTRIGLDVSSASWDPIVGLYSATPGQATVLTVNNPTNNKIDRIAPPSFDAFDMGDVLGQVITQVNGPTLTGANDNFTAANVGCGALSGGLDQVFKFTPAGNTTVRIVATPGVANFYPVVSVFDGPPPTTLSPTPVPAYDASSVTLPDSNCQAFSYHDSSLPDAHVYTLCPTRRYSDEADGKCITAGMDHLASVGTPAEQTFLASLVAPTTTTYGHHIGLKKSSSFGWRDSTAGFPYSNWESGEPNEPTQTCGAIRKNGRWEDKLCTSSGALADDQAYYICEDATRTVPPAEDLATAQTLNVAGSVLNVTGSTLRMYNNYNAASLFAPACGGTTSAGDAVFKITPASTFTVTIDTTGSSYSPVIGLFDGTIDLAGYKACDAAGGAPLSYSLLGGHTYYLLVDGTATSPEGAYKLKLTDTSVAGASDNGAYMNCGAGLSAAPNASVDVEVEGNHTYYFVVDSTSATVGAYSLQVNALYQARTTLTNSAATNERGASAFSLPDPYRSKIRVVDTTTGGMAADYASGVVCSGVSGAPDAVYKMRPSANTGLRVSVKPIGPGLDTPVVGLYDGPPPTSPVLHDLTADGNNVNDNLGTSEPVSFGSSTQRYDGNTSAMASDVDPSLASCGSARNGRDAMFSFSLTEATQVEIDASASAMTDPVLRLFKDGPRVRPTAALLENDDRASANANPAPTPDIQDAWLNYTGDMSNLTSDAQVQSSVAAGNNDSVTQDLGDLAGKRVTVGGANTSGMQADYPSACGAADSSKDAIYRFHSSTATELHVAAAPSSGYDMMLELYQGTNGAPLRLVDQSSLTEDRTCVTSPATAPRNLTRPTLELMDPDIASAVDVDLSCATPGIDTTDPDGAGAQVVTFSGWCGSTPTAYVQSQAGGPDAVVLLMKKLNIPSGTTLRLTGDRPLIFVVTEDASIDGVVNADGSALSNVAGPGGGTSCSSSAGGNSTNLAGYTGGGGGGGYATAGGLGGVGNLVLAGGSVGAARGNTQLVPLLAGCNGGYSDASIRVGRAGGAVQISALGTISIGGSALISANGSDGITPSLSTLGGTGGGSGGAILLEAFKLTYGASSLSVNGGKGGSGASGGGSGGSASTVSTNPGGPGANGGAAASGGGGGGGFGRTRTQTRTMTLAPCGPDGNEDAATAASMDVDSSGRTMIELGDLRQMGHDYDLSAYGAASDARDAVYAFTLSTKSDIEIDGTSSPLETVIALYDNSSLTSGGSPIAVGNKDKGFKLLETLGAGDYRIVVSSALTDGDKFDVRVRNTNFAATAAVNVACDTAGQALVYPLAANTDYYLVVKGASAAESGSYGLLLETAGVGPSMGCGVDAGAPDAVYKFHVASQRTVAIDTIGSSFDTVLAIYPASATAFDTNYAFDANGVQLPCDDNSGSSLAGRIEAPLAAGDYYAVVKSKSTAWSSTVGAYRVSIRDSQATSALACASSSIGARKILQTLQPGNYSLIVSSESTAGGAYSVKFRDVSHFGLENGVQLACANGAGNSVTYGNFEAGRDYYVVVKGNAATESGAYELSVEDTVSLSAAAGSTAVACAAEGSKIDAVYPPGTYYALISGSSAADGGGYTLSVQDLDAQNDQNREACDDNSGPNKTSAIETTVSAGTHYVVVKGKGLLDRGGYRLRVRDMDAVSDQRLACAGGSAGTSRLEYDVKAGQDYTLLMKGADDSGEGAFDLKMFDKNSSPSASGSMLQCRADAQPSPLKGSTWDTRAHSFDRVLTAPPVGQPDKTYYVAVKGVRSTDSGFFQLQIGEPSARTTATYTAPTWATTRDALVASGVRVLPVIATKGDTAAFVNTAKAQAKLLATASGAVRADGTPIWQEISENGTGTGTGLVSAIAELAAHLAMDVTLSAVDGPDPGATRFQINISPLNSTNCTNPHPLVDSTGACTGMAGTYNCSTQYKCRPGAAPKFRVSFTNPATTPVPPNPDNQYGGYLFKLQLKGDGKYLLDEIPVFIIPTTKPLPPAPGSYASVGEYAQNIDASSCKYEPDTSADPKDKVYVFNPRSTELPQWRDLWFKADVPIGSSIDFELCTADTEKDLDSCKWSEVNSMRKKITVTGGPTAAGVSNCLADSECVNVSGNGNGFCSDWGVCQFIDQPKVDWDRTCTDDSACKDRWMGPYGATDYVLSSHCETKSSAFGYGHCVLHSAPADVGATLPHGEDGKLFSRVRVKLHANSAGTASPTLYEWQLTYRCQSEL
ncbi:MAG TPA: C-type lectin domain-containing protein [Polyangiales bacterium]|nr:C-type lectin domain-containing protein [Polyangiales bacterium]